MGLSKGKTTTKVNETEKATTKPITPPWLEQPIQDFTGKIGSYMNSDPAQYIAGTAPLQQKAFDTQLGGWQAPVNSAIGMAQSAVGAPPPQATASLAASQNYNAPMLGNAAEAGTVKIDPNARAEAQSLLTGLKNYQDPYIRDVVNSTLADYDASTGRQAAALSAAGARGGAFGGSRFGIAEGQFQGEAGRGRAATTAGLLSDSFKTAAQLSGQDADRRQGVSYFNSGADNARNMAQAQLLQQREMANQAAANQFRLTQGGMDAQAASQNAQLGTQASMFNAGNQTDISQTNAALQAQQVNQALQAAGLVGNLGLASGEGQRADTGLTADLGQAQRAIEQARLAAPVAQLDMTGSLLSGLPYPALVGQQADSTLQGTRITKDKPSIMSMLLAAGEKAASAYAAGAG